MSTITRRPSEPTIMDCTLRDGSYSVDFGFSGSDTDEVVRRLEECGVSYIEVGHGIGIGASESIVRAKCSDTEYAEAAVSAKNSSRVGMFAIGGLATTDQIRKVGDLGIDFLRIGVTPDSPEAGVGLIRAAQELKIEVFVNFMKSYVADALTMASQVRFCLDYGVDGMYLVDSAGGMLPEDVRRYAEAIAESRGTSSLLLGFHGHDNLGLAVSNSLTCLEQGFEIVDTTLQGIGRSAGNAPTERVVALLTKLLKVNTFDIEELCRFSDHKIRPFLGRPGTSGLDTFAGYTDFHSSFMEALLTVSDEFKISPYALMSEHTRVNKLSGSEGELRLTAASSSEKRDTDFPFESFRYRSGDQ